MSPGPCLNPTSEIPPPVPVAPWARQAGFLKEEELTRHLTVREAEERGVEALKAPCGQICTLAWALDSAAACVPMCASSPQP